MKLNIHTHMPTLLMLDVCEDGRWSASYGADVRNDARRFGDYPPWLEQGNPLMQPFGDGLNA